MILNCLTFRPVIKMRSNLWTAALHTESAKRQKALTLKVKAFLFPLSIEYKKDAHVFSSCGLGRTQWTRRLNKKRVDVDSQAASAYS